MLNAYARAVYRSHNTFSTYLDVGLVVTQIYYTRIVGILFMMMAFM